MINDYFWSLFWSLLSLLIFAGACYLVQVSLGSYNKAGLRLSNFVLSGKFMEIEGRDEYLITVETPAGAGGR
jgi:hypothetical protein